MKRIISAIMALVILLTLVSCGNTQKENWSEHFEAGQKFLLDGNYEQAIIEFNKVIEIEPRNVDAYLGLADAYVAQGDYDMATEVLEKGYVETESSELQSKINELKRVAATWTDAMTSADPDQSAEDFSWTLDNGVLTIRGHGRMPDYNDSNSRPWNDISKEIRQVIIENGITSIGDGAFDWCTSLTSITIPDGVTSIGKQAFADCTNLTSVRIPDSVTSIGDSAFADCNSLTSITIPNSVMGIGEHAFSYCINLASITIPDRVTSIRDNTFGHCYGLTSITIPDSITSIEGNPFLTCASLTDIIVNNNSEYCSVDGVLFTKDMTEIIAYPGGKQSGYYNIPTGVTKIRGGAFSNCDNLTGITIPDSVTSIGGWSFERCYNLTSITIPDSVTIIEPYAFLFSSNLTDIYCEAESQPAGWYDEWLDEDSSATIHWGYKG